MSGLQGSGRTTASRAKANDLSLVIGNQAISGWEEVNVIRSCERVPSAFAITATERYPGEFWSVWIEPGTPCRVKIGDDVLITGYVDAVSRKISPDRHIVHATGRSKVEDLVDCSVTSQVLQGMQVVAASLIDLAKKVCAPYGIGVSNINTEGFWFNQSNLQILTFSADLGSTAFEVLEHAARYAADMLYDNENGDLVIASVGAGGTMASGFAEGVNVQAASGTFDFSQRFSVYQPSFVSYQMYSTDPNLTKNPLPPVYDKSMPRFRPHAVISEQSAFGQSLAQKRAQWEMSRRYGRSQAVRITCDSWRDSGGNLWRPNAFAHISLPSIKCAPPEPWIIADVAFRRDARAGTTAELLLMPKEAFAVQPEFLLAYAWGTNSKNASGAGADQPLPGQGGM